METNNIESTPDLLFLLKQSENLVKEEDIKIVVNLKAAGNAPILSNNKIKISGSVRIANLLDYLKKSLKKAINETDSIFIYCNNNFSPSLNSYVIDLYNNYNVNKELVVYYALSEAWG